MDLQRRKSVSKQAKPALNASPAAQTASPEAEIPVQAPEAAAPAVVIPDAATILEVLAKVQSELAQNRAELAALKAQSPRRVVDEEDLTDSLLFLARPNGETWTERFVVDGKAQAFDFNGTSFYGPFDNQAQVDEYLKAKRLKRPDAHITWADVEQMTGREARRLRADEKQAIRARFGGMTAVNILDRRMRPILDEVTGPLDRVGSRKQGVKAPADTFLNVK